MKLNTVFNGKARSRECFVCVGDKKLVAFTENAIAEIVDSCLGRPDGEETALFGDQHEDEGGRRHDGETGHDGRDRAVEGLADGSAARIATGRV